MRKPQNYLAMAGFVEEFLHDCLHGEVEPFRLGQYNSSAVVSILNSYNLTNFCLDYCRFSKGEFAQNKTF